MSRINDEDMKSVRMILEFAERNRTQVKFINNDLWHCELLIPFGTVTGSAAHLSTAIEVAYSKYLNKAHGYEPIE
jgi:hypothetical protein